VVTHWTWST